MMLGHANEQLRLSVFGSFAGISRLNDRIKPLAVARKMLCRDRKAVLSKITAQRFGACHRL